MVWLIRIIQIHFTFIIALPGKQNIVFFPFFFFSFYISISFECHFYFLLYYNMNYKY